MIGRLQQAADFRRLLDAPVRQRSAHFAVHYLRADLESPVGRGGKPAGHKLSTGHEPICSEAVDDMPTGRWLGCMVPKRHARRAVTRSLIKRQMRSVVGAHEHELPWGQWLIRLSRPFSPQDFPSAASDALRRAARRELERLVSALTQLERVSA
jgi:ribonuclease P protein component